MVDTKKVNDILLAANNTEKNSYNIPPSTQQTSPQQNSSPESTYRGNEGFGKYTSDSDYLKGDPQFKELSDFKGLPLGNGDDNRDLKKAFKGDASDVIQAALALSPTPQGLILDSVDNLSTLLEGGANNDTLLGSTDGIWIGGWVAHNVETGQNVALAGKTQSHDVFHGGAGYDILELGATSDAFFLDNSFSPFYNAINQTRLLDIEEIRGNGGDDIIDLTSNTLTVGDIVLRGGDGTDYLWSNDGNDTLDGEAGSDSLYGGAGDDRLIFDAADIAIDGGSDEDTLVFAAGSFNLITLAIDIDNIEIFELHDTDLTLDKSAIDAATDAGNEITINGDVASTVTLSGPWVMGASAGGYTEYTNAGTVLNISDAVTVI